MGYNYSKQWLDQQSDLIQMLVDLARDQDAGVVTFEDYTEARRYQFHVRNVLAGLALYYPHMEDITKAIRVWNQIDRETGAFQVWVGTENNFVAPTRQTITQRKTPVRLRGRKPTGPEIATPITGRQALGLPSSTPTPLPPDEPETPSTFTYDELVTDDQLPELFHSIGRNCATVHHSRVLLTHMDVSKDKFIETMKDTIVAREFQVVDVTGIDTVNQAELNFIGDFVKRLRQ